MIEIVFSESACGGLKQAQHYGEGEYSDGISGVALIFDDGQRDPTPEELQAAQLETEESFRLQWKSAVPIGGNRRDVFAFDLILSDGDISSDDFASNRQKTIHSYCAMYSDMPIHRYPDIISKLQSKLQAVTSRAANGEDVRIWYSNNPDEMCGLYWFMSELQPYEGQLGNVYIVKLPEHENLDAWGGVSAGDWGRYVTLAEATTSVFRKHCADQWADLQKENSPLRVVLNGQLVSASETIYDYYIQSEITKQKGEFQEGKLISKILSNYSLGIGDGWIHLRIEKMICDGELTVVKGPKEDCPVYSRVLRKVNIDA